ncbi:tyrosine-type recombinase/integrase [Aquiflexum gelatinilyticum]|uniref:tyrosine-type recombinase/integrase n=1 Tax=Aquiflexum gelatinilyticum TaxID=2961943 RepID=UPI00216772B3|nr:site-specific integrase [Aquiflexum gelatinilyticum]MCS4432835.1 site-specific integrase [Aquiflexum gelatinilyticum]
MKVKLRKRKKGKKLALYLDYYQKGFRKTEYLDIFLIPEPEKGKLSAAQVARNKETLRLAEAICHQKQLDFLSGAYDVHDIKKQKSLFIPYLEKLSINKNTSSGNDGNWKSMIKHFKEYAHPGVTFENITVGFIEGFKKHLDKAIKSNRETLSLNSKVSYFNKFLAAMKQAKTDGIIPVNPAERVAPFRPIETRREFLTIEELEALVKTDCDIAVLKSAFLFSCLTGLRFTDIQKLRWEDVRHTSDNGFFIRFRQRKTQAEETLIIPQQAAVLMGQRDGEGGTVFRGLHYSAWNNQKLESWMVKAGIHRKVTFHAARHTNAVMHLSKGTDIFTVSKLLGHKSLKTTQIYAKVMDQQKKQAVDKIILENLK